MVLKLQDRITNALVTINERKKETTLFMSALQEEKLELEKLRQRLLIVYDNEDEIGIQRILNEVDQL